EIRAPMVERRDFPAALFAKLYDETRPVSATLSKFQADFAPGGDDNEKLYELMLRSDLFGTLRECANGAKTVSRLAGEMGVSHETLVHLIAASAKAVKGGTSLIKARYHFFLRALEGAYIALAGDRELYLTRREFSETGHPVFECAICEDCGRIALVGRLDNERLLHPKQGFDEHTDFFLVKQNSEIDFFSGDEDDSPPDEEPDEALQTDENDYVICPICGAVEMEGVALHSPMCEHSPKSYIKLRRAKARGGYAACPACEFGDFRRFYLGYEAATAVLGTALYEQLPDYEIVSRPAPADPGPGTGFFGIARELAPVRAEHTRQFLAFSDSRADAAFFASYMEKSYQEFLRRRGLWQVCSRMLEEGRVSFSAREAVAALSRLFEASGSFVEIGKERESQIDICRQHAYIAVINELVSSRRSSGLVQLGKLSYVYSPKSAEKQARWNRAIEVIASNMPSPEYAERDAVALLNLLILDIVYGGALDAGEEFSLNGDDREYLFYAPNPKKVVKVKQEGAKSHINGFIPRRRTGNNKSFYPSTRMTRVMRAMGFPDEKAWSLLQEIWREILGFEDNTEYALPIQDFDIALYSPETQSGGIALYRCAKCGRVTAHNCQDRCVNVKCAGRLERFHPESANATNHYVNLYSSNNMKPFYMKEHTAQLSRERGAEYQKLFVEKKLNALSSSTTFEMGVDVGSL
ncbi:hypothetical protein LJC34_08155, partial [Oscillospiraceae bacterium OttesenSCG-928-G22]|nr:hypothetical protein [Oscillospiraceae bacterium OttesenSCG-928-G22]